MTDINKGTPKAKPDRVIVLREVNKPIKPKPVEAEDKDGLDAELKNRIRKNVGLGLAEADIKSMIGGWSLNGQQDKALEFLHKIYTSVVDDAEPLRDISGGRYCIKCNCMYLLKYKDGSGIPDEEIKLSNFVVKIIEDIYEDNGIEQTRYLRLNGRLYTGEILPTNKIPASDFKGMNWIINLYGIRPQLEPGQNVTDHFRRGTSYLSEKAKIKSVYTHTGWRHDNDQHFYLIGSGAVNSKDVEAEMHPQLSRYCLPQPNTAAEMDKQVLAMKVSLEYLNIGKLEVTLPIWTGMYLAPLNEFESTSFTLWLLGSTGSFKTVMCTLALSHYGDFDDRHPPSAWLDTKNELEKMMFICKDCPLLIDDWAPGASPQETHELKTKAERLIRAQGNRMGRHRMKSDTSSQTSFNPRGLLISTGELPTGGQSRSARMLTIPIERSDIDIDLLTSAQKQKYYYAQAMSNYIYWISQNWETVKKEFKDNFEYFRKIGYSDDKHLRLVDIVAMMTAGLSIAIKYAVEIGSMERNYGTSLINEGWKIFTDLSLKQDEQVKEEKPATKFLNAIQSLLDSKTGVLFSKDFDGNLAPGQCHLGWIDNIAGIIYLHPGNATQAVTQYYQKSGDHFAITKGEIIKDLYRDGLLAEFKDDKELTVCRWLSNSTKRVIAIYKNIIFPPQEEENPKNI